LDWGNGSAKLKLEGLQVKGQTVKRNWMLYGAYGYIGHLILEQALAQGLKPVLAGRREADLKRLSKAHGLEYVCFGLNAAESALSGTDVLLNCAGPFSRTAPPMIAACLSTGTHYLDITGEIGTFAHAHECSELADRAGVLLCPGVGFEVVPSDCLAARLKQCLPDATHLYLALEGEGRVSPGAAKASIEAITGGGCIRRDGQLHKVPWGYHHRSVDFGGRRRNVVTVPWGDVYTAFVSTGIANVEVYLSVSEAMLRRLKRLRWIRPFLGFQWVQNLLKAKVDREFEGPDSAHRKRTNSFIWGEVRNEQGASATGRMLAPNTYTLTALAACGVVQSLMERESVPTGYMTPSQLMGADYASSLPGVLLTVK
jgi:short subunit dehydrogenase-like uncharacterized protein